MSRNHYAALLGSCDTKALMVQCVTLKRIASQSHQDLDPTADRLPADESNSVPICKQGETGARNAALPTSVRASIFDFKLTTLSQTAGGGVT